ncbi:MAG: hypothetical protein K9H41_06255 [Bacteroidia bacterium]|jgi:hypothetical protein|nr:hypothetical protein [Bacteroidia bacterium]
MSKSKYIETPERLMELFKEYKLATKENPILIHDFVGVSAKESYRKKEKPLTLEGFETYCFENDIINDLGDYFSNKDKSYNSYSTICKAIKTMIKADQLTGGLCGIYNSSITQRLCGLTDKVNLSNNMERPLFPGIDINLDLPEF